MEHSPAHFNPKIKLFFRSLIEQKEESKSVFKERPKIFFNDEKVARVRKRDVARKSTDKEMSSSA